MREKRERLYCCALVKTRSRDIREVEMLYGGKEIIEHILDMAMKIIRYVRLAYGGGSPGISCADVVAALLGVGSSRDSVSWLGMIM